MTTALVILLAIFIVFGMAIAWETFLNYLFDRLNLTPAEREEARFRISQDPTFRP